MRKHQKIAVEETAVVDVRPVEETPTVVTLEQVPENALCRVGNFLLRRIARGTFRVENIFAESKRYKVGDKYSLVGANGKVPVTLVGV